MCIFGNGDMSNQHFYLINQYKKLIRTYDYQSLKKVKKYLQIDVEGAFVSKMEFALREYIEGTELSHSFYFYDLKYRCFLECSPKKIFYFIEDLPKLFEKLMQSPEDNEQALTGIYYLTSRYKLQDKFAKNILGILTKLANTSPHAKLHQLAIKIILCIIIEDNKVLDIEIISLFVGLLRTTDQELIKLLIEKINLFLSDLDNTHLLVKLNVVSNLCQIAKKSQDDYIMDKSCRLIAQFLLKTNITVSPQQIASCFEILFDITSNSQRTNCSLVRKYSKALFQYIFKNNLQHMLTEKGVFVKLLSALEHHPQILRKIFLSLSKQKEHFENMLAHQLSGLFKFMRIVLPFANLQSVWTIFQMIEVILCTNKKEYLKLIWSQQIILNCIQESMSFNQKFILKALDIYQLLIITPHYQQISHRIKDKQIANVLIETISKDKFRQKDNIVRQTLVLIRKILNFERQKYKLANVQQYFTQNLRQSKYSNIIQDIYQRQKGNLKQNAFYILSQNFIKIKGQLKSIKQPHQQKVFDL